MPARYVRPYSKGQKNDFRDAEAIAEAVLRPTMKLLAIKTVEQLDLQGLHRVRERLVCQRTSVINHVRASNLRVASAALGRCNFSAEHRDLAGCPICTPSTAAYVTSGMSRKETQGPTRWHIAEKVGT